VQRRYRALTYDAAAARADAVITVSDFAKDRIVHHLGLSPERVHVAPLGVRPVPRPRRRSLGEPFLLYPARAWAHKDHATLLRAVPLLRRAVPGVELVLTGAAPASLPPLPDGVRALGNVPAAGAAPAVRDRVGPRLPEPLRGVRPTGRGGDGRRVPGRGGAGRGSSRGRRGRRSAVRAGDVGGLVEAVREALDRSDDLRARGLRRAEHWTWGRCAQAHVSVYERLGA
jgi:glycosyltransferase involved in cell wall biosynthesis